MNDIIVMEGLISKMRDRLRLKNIEKNTAPYKEITHDEFRKTYLNKIKKCQNLMWTNMMKLKSKYPMIAKMLYKRHDNELIVPMERENDIHTNTFLCLIDYNGSDAELFEKEYLNFDRSELEPALSEIAKDCVDKIFGDDSNIDYEENGDYKNVYYGIVFRDTFIHVN